MDMGFAYWMSSAPGHHSRISAAISQRPDRAQAAEDAAWSERVADWLVNPEGTRDLHVVAVGFDAADLESADDEIRPGESFSPLVWHFHLRAEVVRLDQAPRSVCGDRDPIRIGIVQAQLALLQRGKRQDVPDQGEREDVAPGSDNGDFQHVGSSVPVRWTSGGERAAARSSCRAPIARLNGRED